MIHKSIHRSLWFVVFFLVPPLTVHAAGPITPVGVEFDISTLTRQGQLGDNWCQTWAADDSVITALDDGHWFGSGPALYHSRLYRLTGDSDSFSVAEIDGYPRYTNPNGDGWFAYGVISVDGILYSLISKTQGRNWSTGPFRGMKLLRSYDSGATWFRVDKNNQDRFLDGSNSNAARIARELLTDDEMFFFEEFGRVGQGRAAYPFSYAAFVQNGRDNSASQDGYVYIYSPEGASSHQLLLARVLADRIGLRSAWEYFSGWDNGVPQWSSNIEARQPNLLLPDKNSNDEYFGWYSWLPSVVWNPGLQLYVMVNGGTYAGEDFSQSNSDYYDVFMHTQTGSLGMWYSENPYGPWKQFYYTDYWTVDDPANLTYQPKLSPKWISDDGQKMTLIWSDAMRNANGFSHTVNYRWNQMEIDILIEEESDDTIIPMAEVTLPANGSEVIAAVQDISGAATDADSGVSEVLVRVRRLGASAGFWSESGWVAESTWLEATLDGSDWTLADVDLTEPTDYRVNVRAFDNAGNHAQSSANPRTDFTVISADETIPSAEATLPADGSEVVAGVHDISGVATDADSGVSEVLVRVRRLGASAGFWSESGWVAESTWLEATLDGSDWNLADVDLTEPTDYRVNVRAFDNAGNHAQSSTNPRTDFTVN